jgi:hypothetical protein
VSLTVRAAAHSVTTRSCADPSCIINQVLDRLGIDPDMDVETLRRRLTYGERVEQCVKVGILVSTEGKYHGRFVRTADDLLDSLTRPAGSSGTETTP